LKYLKVIMTKTPYTNSILKQHENILSVAKVTKWILIAPIFVMIISLLLTSVFFEDIRVNHELNIFLLFGPFLLLYAIKQFIENLIYIFTTEMVLTNERVIYKTGLIQRYTTEIPINQIESVNVKQNILGRILRFGDIDIIGTGSTNQHLKYIANIMKFKQKI